MAPISIDILANTGSVLRATKDVEGALDSVAGSLDDLARDSERAGDKLADGISDGAKDAGDSVERLERTFKDLADASKRTSTDAGQDLGRSYKAGAEQASEGLDEIKRESASTAKESAASFDGSAESIVDSFQEIAANAFAGFGAAGLIAGLAAAAGIGLIVSKITEANEDTEEYRQTVADLAGQFIETGGIGAAGITAIIDRLKELATETDDQKDSLEQIEDLANRTGTAYDKLARAYAGNQDELDELLRKQYEIIDSYADDINALEGTEAERADLLHKRMTAAKDIVDGLADVSRANEEAAEAEARWLEAGGPELAAKAAAIDAVNDAYDDAAGALDDYTNKETGLFDVGAYLTAMGARSKALRDYQTNLASSGLSPEAMNFLNSQGADAAATFLAGYMSTSETNKARLNNVWTEAGKDNSGEYSKALDGGLKAKPIAAPKIERPVVPAPDMSRVEQALSRSRTLRINVATYDSRTGRRID